ncbi:hypothetical protein DID76_02235 [Candidatus Marinamargulisbacteria bacterium SCGC AG-414-C22]|nr:hypothetical protein DID76_02235 [Candidatus Marinamargulisbacteria bacterium SCGC AG-414-C22]
MEQKEKATVNQNGLEGSVQPEITRDHLINFKQIITDFVENTEPIIKVTNIKNNIGYEAILSSDEVYLTIHNTDTAKAPITYVFNCNQLTLINQQSRQEESEFMLDFIKYYQKVFDDIQSKNVTIESLDIIDNSQQKIKQSKLTGAPSTPSKNSPDIIIKPSEIKKFRDIVLTFFNKKNTQITVNGTKENIRYKTEFTREKITYQTYPKLSSETKISYTYHLSKGSLINTVTLKELPNERLNFFKIVEHICNNIHSNNVLLEFA